MNIRRRHAFLYGTALLLACGNALAQDRALRTHPRHPVPRRSTPPSSPSKNLAPTAPDAQPDASGRVVGVDRSRLTQPEHQLRPDATRPLAEQRHGRSVAPSESSAAPSIDDARGAVQRAAAPSDDEIDGTLVGFGTWTDDPTYGRVWTPSAECVGSDFTPYLTGGRWKLDGDQRTWESNYPWGPATFHFGNWIWRDGRTWSWVPGKTYSPAWVTWRREEPGARYVGWAPAPPTMPDGVEVPPSPLGYRFVPAERLTSPTLSKHVVTDPALGKLLLELTQAANVVASPGPRVELQPGDTVSRSPAARRVVSTQTLERPVPQPTSPQPSGYRCRLVTDAPPTWRCAWE